MEYRSGALVASAKRMSDMVMRCVRAYIVDFFCVVGTLLSLVVLPRLLLVVCDVLHFYIFYLNPPANFIFREQKKEKAELGTCPRG